MVSKVEEALKRRQHKQQQPQKQQQLSKVCKFKRSTSNIDEDGASTAILLLACIVCAPSYP
ncbi:hypothetical protein D8674_012362 [Pyrus ussuriensis x Pyrus communis]|uniref:Uncharacterized protein n=1 Tax=Pyrus ussuriensis x Pyrus communis TaxID=2448454 RepID=A0A5N5GEQ5_9ROSA|nr:hypothetical protein D8674_012362 [Pyrus ussuriensis x Pyrus communis]